MHRRFPRSRRLAPVTLALVALGGAIASCNAVLGLDDFKNCPQDPGCPGTGGGPTCTDGEKNGQETDIDCGGSTCARCADGKACDVGSDCAGGTCSSGKCHTPSCTDGEKNGQETDIDCGGPACGKCADDKGCNNGSDCTSKVCTGGTCLAPACGDLVQNGDETDTDCGGATCGKCDVGKGCAADADCKGGSCGMDGKCAATCTDGVKDGDETDVDCGGATCPKCAVTEGCATGPDCETGVCQGGACVSFYKWAKRFGDSNEQIGKAVVADGIGNTYLLSTVAGSVDFGGGVQTVAMQTAIATAKFDPAGALVWSKVFTGGQNNDVTSVAVTNNNEIVFTGSAKNLTDFGGGPLAGNTLFTNFYVAKLGTGGNHLFSKMVPGGKGMAVTVTTFGSSVVIGDAGGAGADYGCGGTPSSGGEDMIVVSYGLNNGCSWSKRFGGGVDTTASGTAIASAEAGAVIVGGTVQGTLDLGCGPVTTSSAGTGSLLLAKLDANGSCVWSELFSDPNHTFNTDISVRGVAVDGSGNITIAGDFNQAVDFGTGPLTATGNRDSFLARFDPSGTVQWAKHFGKGGGHNRTLALATSGTGNVAFTGSTSIGIDFGGGPLPTGSVFVAEFDGAGNHVWSRDFGAAVPAIGFGIAFAPTNDLLLTGAFSAQIDFGGGALTTMGSSDIFLAKLLVP